ncbi:Histidine containing phosphotransfer protein [Hirschfeldia incana]|nr:Histidine containing phosphotransfer protein [Hirschfeldia incana]
MRQSFFDEGYLNCQYTQIEALEKDSSPYFIVEIITLYFRDSPNVIAALEHEFIGAIKINNELEKANILLQAGNIDGMKAAVRDIKKEHNELRAKFETYFQLMRQAGPTEQAVNSS